MYKWVTRDGHLAVFILRVQFTIQNKKKHSRFCQRLMYLHYQNVTIEIQDTEWCDRYLRYQYMREVRTILICYVGQSIKKNMLDILWMIPILRIRTSDISLHRFSDFKSIFSSYLFFLAVIQNRRNGYQDIEFIILLFPHIWASVFAVKKYLHLPRTNMHD